VARARRFGRNNGSHFPPAPARSGQKAFDHAIFDEWKVTKQPGWPRALTRVPRHQPLKSSPYSLFTSNAQRPVKNCGSRGMGLTGL